MYTVLRTMGFFLLVKSIAGKKGYKTGASRRYYNIPLGFGYLHSTKKASDVQDHKCTQFTK